MGGGIGGRRLAEGGIRGGDDCNCQACENKLPI